MKFEKKIIIGSITSFIITAVGVIAVFFPSLLNLEKERVKDVDVFLSNKKSVDGFLQILEKNKGKVISLDLTYCADMSQKDWEKQQSEYSDLLERSENGEDMTFVNVIERYLGDAGLTLVAGFDPIPHLYEFRSTETASLYFYGKTPYDTQSEEQLIIKSLKITPSSDNKYLISNFWSLGFHPEDNEKEKYEKELKTCSSFGRIKGKLFYVDIKEYQEPKDPNLYVSYELEPLSEKEFELRNY